MNVKNFVKDVGRGIFWTLLIIIFGLSQLWYTLGKTIFLNDDNLNFFDITKNGILLFFILALNNKFSIGLLV